MLGSRKVLQYKLHTNYEASKARLKSILKEEVYESCIVAS